MTIVYRAYDEANRLLYLGCSDDFRRRQRTHQSTAPWYSQTARWDCREYPNRESGLIAEMAAIAIEQPIHNRATKTPIQVLALAAQFRRLGWSMDMVANEMNRRGYPPPGAPCSLRWYASSVRTVLKRFDEIQGGRER